MFGKAMKVVLATAGIGLIITGIVEINVSKKRTDELTSAMILFLAEKHLISKQTSESMERLKRKLVGFLANKELSGMISKLRANGDNDDAIVSRLLENEKIREGLLEILNQN